MEIDICIGTLSSPSDHSEDTTQAVTQSSGPEQSAIQQSSPAETPMEEPNKDDGMGIDAHISGNSNGRDPSNLRNEEQESSSSDRQTPPQVQAKVNTAQAVISRLDNQKIKEPIIEKGSRKRQSEEGNEPARKAKKKYHSGKARTEKKRAMKAAYKA